jgi:hypothetical protein
MANVVKPASNDVERWMRVPMGGGMWLFFFSGYANFGSPEEPLQGVGVVDTDQQAKWVNYEVTDMIVGPHWLAVRDVCPMVVAAGHSQVSPDEADAMGYEVTKLKDVNEVNFSDGAFRRIELQVNLRVRGGTDGKIPSLAYNVSAMGLLAPVTAGNPDGIGTEGVFFFP